MGIDNSLEKADRYKIKLSTRAISNNQYRQVVELIRKNNLIEQSNLVIDLSGLKMLTMQEIAYLVSCKQDAEQYKVELVLTSVSKETMFLFKLTGLEHFFKFSPAALVK